MEWNHYAPKFFHEILVLPQHASPDSLLLHVQFSFYIVPSPALNNCCFVYLSSILSLLLFPTNLGTLWEKLHFVYLETNLREKDHVASKWKRQCYKERSNINAKKWSILQVASKDSKETGGWNTHMVLWMPGIFLRSYSHIPIAEIQLAFYLKQLLQIWCQA